MQNIRMANSKKHSNVTMQPSTFKSIETGDLEAGLLLHPHENSSFLKRVQEKKKGKMKETDSGAASGQTYGAFVFNRYVSESDSGVHVIRDGPQKSKSGKNIGW